MSNYFEKYKRRNLKQYDTILDKERSDLIADFEYYLTHEALSAYEIQYTKPDELINKETNSTERMVIKDVADNANMIINGYAYTKDGDYIRVLNLNCLNNAAVIYKDEIVETNMDDIEIQIVLDYYNKNKEFMEEADAEVL